MAVVGTIMAVDPVRITAVSPHLPEVRSADLTVLMTIGITFFIIGIVNFIFGPTLKPIPLPQTAEWPAGYRLPHRCRPIACSVELRLRPRYSRWRCGF